MNGKVTFSMLVALMVLSAHASGAVPSLINYQGRLLDNGGNPVNGNITVSVSIFSNQTGSAAAVYSESIGTVAVQNGIYSFSFGNNLAALRSTFANAESWLEVSINASPLSPRQRLIAVPYALVAETVQGSSLFISPSTGNVGINTTAPGAKLHVLDGNAVVSKLEGNSSDATVQHLINNNSSQTWGLGVAGPNNLGGVANSKAFYIRDESKGENRLVIGPNGNVGIHTATPGANLHVFDLDRNAVLSKLEGNSSDATAQFLINNNSAQTWGLGVAGQNNLGGVANSKAFYIRDESKGENRLVIDTNGNVGIGTVNPQTGLHVQGYLGLYGTRTVLAGFDSGGLHWVGPSPDTDLAYGVQRLGANNYIFHWNGKTSTRVLQINGGSDIAEPFDVAGATDVPKGSVLVIDETNPGRLKLSDQPYDKHVAGIASGAGGINPGITLTQDADSKGQVNVAMTGRVYVWADAVNGPIRPGDLLTTSSVPGHAMKVTDFSRAQGAIIGKAMSPLNEGTDLVLLLVNPQ